MVLVTRNGVTYSVHQKLYDQIINFSVEKLKEKDEFKLFIVCGSGGSGKSAFANQMCALLDKDFGLKNIGFTNQQFKKILMTMINRAVTFDEAYRGISKRNTLGKEQREILQMFFEVRQLNQLIFLCTPSFWSLDEAIAVELSHGLFYIYKIKVKGKKNGSKKRVFYKFFNRKKKAKLYYLGKKIGKNYNLVHTNFKGPVPTNTYVVDEKEYRKYKFESLYGSSDEPETSLNTNGPKYNYKDREARLWACIVKLSGSYGKAVLEAQKAGIKLTKSAIQARIAENPEVSAFVSNK